MARLTQDAIDTFISITGTSEAVALQKLEEHDGDLNEAVNSHFNQGDRMNSISTTVPMPRDDFMDIDDPLSIRTAAPEIPLFSAIRRRDPFSILESQFLRNPFDGGINEFTNRAPRVSHPRDVREIPIEFKDHTYHSGSSGRGPKIEEITGSVSELGPEVHGTVIIDDEDELLPSAPPDGGVNRSGDVLDRRHSTTNIFPLTDVTDYPNDIEEEMIQAAIEASKKEAEEHGKQLYDASKTAERESNLHAQIFDVGQQSSDALHSRMEHSRRRGAANDRQELGKSKSQISNQSNMHKEVPPFEEDEVAETDEEPLVWRRPKRASFGNAPQQITNPPSSPRRHDTANHAHQNGDAFQSDEWGGISSQEHEEAVMLEAAMFGGVPEGTSYHFAYPHHQFTPTNYEMAPNSPSPRLAEQRMLREQQDDAYIASLLADREKELKAVQETEKRRLEEAAEIDAACEREKRQEEETHRKLLEIEEFERNLVAKQTSLPPEPSVDNENSVTFLVRMPDGSRCGRRFLKSDKLKLLFDYLDVGRLVKPGSYRLVRPYPRRSFTDEECQVSLSELGLTSKQEALFLELI